MPWQPAELWLSCLREHMCHIFSREPSRDSAGAASWPPDHPLECGSARTGFLQCSVLRPNHRAVLIFLTLNTCWVPTVAPWTLQKFITRGGQSVSKHFKVLEPTEGSLRTRSTLQILILVQHISPQQSTRKQHRGGCKQSQQRKHGSTHIYAYGEQLTGSTYITTHTTGTEQKLKQRQMCLSEPLNLS